MRRGGVPVPGRRVPARGGRGGFGSQLPHFGRGFGMGLEGIGQALAEAVFGCRGKHSPGTDEPNTNWAKSRSAAAENRYFTLNLSKIPIIFRTFADMSAKNAWIGASMHSRRVF